MKRSATLIILKERTINFSLDDFTPASKNYLHSQKSPGSVVGLSSGPVENLIV